MRSTLAPLTAALLLAAATSALAQPEHRHSPAGRGQPPAGHSHQPEASDGATAHQRVEMCLREFDQVIADGRGFGLAFAADQNGYPGPLHALELTQQLALTPEQEARMTALFDAMLVEARAKAARLAVAEARLRRVFADGAADESAVRRAVAEAEAARAEVRLVHLLTHLKTRDLLTELQRQMYHHLRWGTAKH